tara:strand:- start:2473 stop:3420 length:948 start_codon:yes stop_codon:yes gene_type:complete
MDILQREGWYNESNHNKTESTYVLFGNLFEFISVDQSSRLRGRARSICFINEANEINQETFTQLAMRTSWKIILDYNPSDEFSWIYDAVIPRDDCNFYKSTYLDNPFISDGAKDEIERLKDTDENYWRIYGLGERGKSKETIFQTHIYEELPENANHVGYGLDFGYAADPAALVKVSQRGDELYIEELLYSGGLTNQDLGEKFTELGITRHEEVIADSAEPKSITELSRMNFNVKGATKGPDSIRNGIDILRRHKIHVKADSLNVQKEFRNYKWSTDKDGRILPHPRDDWNHAIDAVRYVCLNKLAHRNRTYYLR